MNIKKVGSWILASFLILSFAVWGIGDMFRGRAPNETIANVGDTKITREELNIQIGRLMNAMRSRLGPDFGYEQAVSLGLIDQTVEQMVNSRILSLEAHRLGLTAGEDLVREVIFSDPRFRGPGNRFDRLSYEQALSQEGVSEGTFVARLRENIVHGQITGAIAAANAVPKVLFDTLYRYRNERRVALVVNFPAGKISDIADPAPATLSDFHQKNPAQFTAPEYRTITAIYLDPDEAAKELRPSEERIAEEYEIRKDARGVPERRRLEQVLLQDETKAKTLAQAARSGRPFADAAKDVAGDQVSDLGWIARRDLPDALARSAFALAKGAVGDPVKTALGWHVVRVTEIEAAKIPTLEELRPEIVRDLARETAIDNFVKQTGKLDDTLAGGATLEDAAAAINARPRRLAAVDPRGNGADGKPVSGLAKSAKFLELGFTTPKGEVTNVEETENGGFLVLRVDEIIPPKLRPFDTVRAAVTQAWKQSQLLDAAKKKAATFLAASKAAGSLARAAEKAGHNPATSKPFTRFIRDPASVVSSALSSGLFKEKPGGIVMAPTDNGYAVAELVKVIPAEPGKNKEESESLKEQLRAARAEDNVRQYIDALRGRYAVRIDEAAVQRATTGRYGG